jgi:hypothetical protein
VQQMTDLRINSLVLTAAPPLSSPTSATKSALFRRGWSN